MPIQSYRDLLVYQKSYQAALELHRLSLVFPTHERYELGRQLREATKSIAANIAEGYGRKESLKDFKRFLQIALGSCDEVRVWLDFCRDLGYMEPAAHAVWSETYDQIGKGLSRMIKVWQ